MKNNVRVLREVQNLTQSELAEKSGLSLRTIQRIEAGSVLKGFTLKTIAQTLNVSTENLLVHSTPKSETDRAKLINISALSGLLIPFAGIILPLILTYRTTDSKNKELGKHIVSIQIFLTLVLSVLMIVSPFLQKGLSLKFPLFILFLIPLICIKLYIIIKNGMSLNQENDLSIKLKNSFL